MVSPVIIRSVLAVLVAAAFIGIAALVFRSGSNDRGAEPKALQQLPENIDIALKKARFSEIRDGSVVWELVAERVEYDKNGEVAHLGDIRMDFARSGTAGALTVTASQGDYFSASRDVRLRGRVHVETENGVIFDTESIDYQALKSRLKTADQVTFQQQRLTLRAMGMEMDVKNQRARFFSRIDARVAGVSAADLSGRPLPESGLASQKKTAERHKGNGR